MCAQIFWPLDLLPHFVLRDNSFHTGNWNCLSIHFHTISMHIGMYTGINIFFVNPNVYYSL